MTINFKSLEKAISQVEQISEMELAFEANGVQVTLRTLRPVEDIDVQRRAQAVLDAETGDAKSPNTVALAEFMDQLRFGLLGYSIVQIDDLDLRTVTYIQNEDENGEVYDQPKHQAVEQLVRDKWSREMLAVVFKKFLELQEKVSVRAQNAVKFDVQDLDQEIERLEKRMEELKEARASRLKPVEDTIVRAREIVGSENNRQVEAREAAGATKTVITAPTERPRAVPPVAPPPPARRPEPVVTTPVEPVAQDDGKFPDPFDGDSFIDTADPDAAIEAEGRRQEILYRQQLEQKARQKAMQEEQHAQRVQEAQVRRAASTVSSPPGGAVDVSTLGGRASRDPGLRQALNTQDAVQRPAAPPIHSATAQRPAQIQGMDVYALEPQVLDRRSQHTGPVIPLDPMGGESSVNPRFRQPR